MPIPRHKKPGARVQPRRSPPSAASCPVCARLFVIGPDFVASVVATGRTWPSGRAELRCEICRHTWWSKGAGARAARPVAAASANVRVAAASRGLRRRP